MEIDNETDSTDVIITDDLLYNELHELIRYKKFHYNFLLVL
jgi:hypothetical protein